jgi:hypothetical protein
MHPFLSWHCGPISSSEHWKRVNHSLRIEIIKMATTSADIAVYVVWLSWTCLSVSHSRLPEKRSLRLCLPAQQVLMVGPHFNFAPGLLDVLQSQTPPTIHCVLQEFTVTHCQDLGSLSPC